MKESGINLFVVTTTYHILISCSMYKEGDILINAGNKSYGLVIKEMIDKTFGKNIISISGLADYKLNKIKILKFRTYMKQLKLSVCQKNIVNIVVFNDVDPEIQWIINYINKTGKVILVEEGIGLYRDIDKRFSIAWKLFGKMIFGYQFKNIKRIGESKKVEQIICKKSALLSVRQKHKEIYPFSNINIELLKSRLSTLEYIEEKNWFIGQPLVEDGILDEKKYLKIIIHLKNICPSLVIKPHPRENRNKYKVMNGIKVVEDNDTPMELMLNYKDNYHFFTFYSSAILSVSNYGKAFALFKIANIKLTKEIENIFLESSVFVVENWDGVKLDEKN